MAPRFASVFLVFATTGLASAQINLKSIQFGDSLVGPQVNYSKLEGQVVLVDLWGIN